MEERIVGFTLGLSAEDIERGASSFAARSGGLYTLEAITITPTLLTANVGETLDRVLAGAGHFSIQEHASSPEHFPYRVVILHAPEREQVLQVMRGFKAVLPDPQDIIFAVVTEMAKTWTFGEYVGHLGSEHEYMKTHTPSDNPDMRRM